MKTQTATTEERVTRRIACTGATNLGKGKQGFGFREVGADGSLSDEFYYGMTKSLRGAGFYCGGVWDVTFTADGKQMIVGSQKYVGAFEDRARVAEWQMRERQERIDIAARKKQKKDAARNFNFDSLEPIRRAYNRTNPIGRLAIEVQVLAWLRYGRDIREDAEE